MKRFSMNTSLFKRLVTRSQVGRKVGKVSKRQTWENLYTLYTGNETVRLLLTTTCQINIFTNVGLSLIIL